ncbi:ATP-grasp domain-containing protein [Streptomyces sp. Edi2]|uniref:ATP-grasp domain-containing protein n=1 Tax=Streptomyces sp. Edi2 TaxID=3162528 RepID=UPI003305628E
MTIAIVDGYSTGATLARRLHAQGVDCIHLQSQPVINDHFQRSFNAHHYTCDLKYTADLRTVANQLASMGVSRVTAGAESGVTTAEILSLKLGLPTNTPGHLAARRDKALMAQAVRSAGLATPRASVASTPATAAAWFTASGLAEAVVKPLASAGTDHVRFCRTAQQVEAACVSVLDAKTIFGRSNHTALIQERLIGTEYYINTVSHNGHHRVAEIWQYTKQANATSTPVYDYEEPLAPSTHEASILRHFTFAVLDALGIRATPAHTEVILTARGPVLIETGARLGGATVPDIVERYSGGISQTALAATAMLNPQDLLNFDENQVAWNGTLRHVEFVNHYQGPANAAALGRVAELSSAVAVFSSVDPGDNIPPTSDLLSSPGHVYLAAKQRDVVERDYARLRSWEREGLHTA